MSNFYKNFGSKLIDVQKNWVFDFNPYIERDVKPDFYIDLFQNQLSIIDSNKRNVHLSNAAEYCSNINLNYDNNDDSINTNKGK